MTERLVLLFSHLPTIHSYMMEILVLRLLLSIHYLCLYSYLNMLIDLFIHPVSYICCCSCSVTKSCPTLCQPSTATHQALLSFTISWSLFKLMFIESVMLSNHLILCCPLLLLPSIFPSMSIFTHSNIN